MGDRALHAEQARAHPGEVDGVPVPGDVRVAAAGAGAEARRLLGRARSELEFVKPGAVLESLETRLASLQANCFEVGEALGAQ